MIVCEVLGGGKVVMTERVMVTVGERRIVDFGTRGIEADGMIGLNLDVPIKYRWAVSFVLGLKMY